MAIKFERVSSWVVDIIKSPAPPMSGDGDQSSYLDVMMQITAKMTADHTAEYFNKLGLN